jgi:hypothetical protein
MKLSFLKRDIPKRAALVVVALAAAASVVTGREKPAIERVETQAARAEPVRAAALDIDLGKLRSRGEGEAVQNDPFASRSFAPPQPAADAAPAAPAAPPLPFRYFGRLTENGRTEVFVMRGDELISIAPGRKIDGEYRVERIGERAIAFTYLPMKLRQSMELPE